MLNGFSEIEAFDKEDHSNEVYHEIKEKTPAIINVINKFIIKLIVLFQKVYRKIFIR